MTPSPEPRITIAAMSAAWLTLLLAAPVNPEQPPVLPPVECRQDLPAAAVAWGTVTAPEDYDQPDGGGVDLCAGSFPLFDPAGPELIVERATKTSSWPVLKTTSPIPPILGRTWATRPASTVE